MGIIVAIVVAAAAAIGSGAKDGLFKKGSDTTRRDTIAFERNALEDKLARTQVKERQVVELNGQDPKALAMQAKLNEKQSKLEGRIAELREREEKLESNN